MGRVASYPVESGVLAVGLAARRKANRVDLARIVPLLAGVGLAVLAFILFGGRGPGLLNPSWSTTWVLALYGAASPLVVALIFIAARKWSPSTEAAGNFQGREEVLAPGLWFRVTSHSIEHHIPRAEPLVYAWSDLQYASVLRGRLYFGTQGVLTLRFPQNQFFTESAWKAMVAVAGDNAPPLREAWSEWESINELGRLHMLIVLGLISCSIFAVLFVQDPTVSVLFPALSILVGFQKRLRICFRRVLAR